MSGNWKTGVIYKLWFGMENFKNNKATNKK